MEDFPTRTYGTSGLDNRPLFGETSAKVSADRDSGLGVCVCVSDSALPLRVLAGPSAASEGTCREKAGSSTRLPSQDVSLPLCSFFGTGLAKILEGWGWREVQKVLGCWGPFSGVRKPLVWGVGEEVVYDVCI